MNRLGKKSIGAIVASSCLLLVAAGMNDAGAATTRTAVTPQAAASSGAASVTSYKVPKAQRWAISKKDMRNAKPMPLPMSPTKPVGAFDGGVAKGSLGTAGFSKGRTGNGKTTPMRLPMQKPFVEEEFASQEFGTSNHPFTTSRAEAPEWYPSRAAGKLYFQIGGSTYVCSASLIKRGLIVTAAHCVAGFGGSFYSNWQFVPGKYNARAMFGVWAGANAWVMTSYLNGTESCYVAGVVCPNDVAVIRLAPQSGAYPGTRTGWFGYGWDGYGFTGGNIAQFTQLGYPVSHESGNVMQRTDSYAYVSGSMSNNSVWGSRQTGGSSGGPELVNFGTRGAMSVPLGAEAALNIVVGVTSWGYTDPAVKQQGASPFTSGNIVPLVNAGCSGSWSGCL